MTDEEINLAIRRALRPPCYNCRQPGPRRLQAALLSFRRAEILWMCDSCDHLMVSRIGLDDPTKYILVDERHPTKKVPLTRCVLRIISGRKWSSIIYFHGDDQ